LSPSGQAVDEANVDPYPPVVVEREEGWFMKVIPVISLRLDAALN
jgi:hypothetical protein